MAARPPVCDDCCGKVADCKPLSFFGSIPGDWTEATWDNSPVTVDFFKSPSFDQALLFNRSVDRQVASGALYRTVSVDDCVYWQVTPTVGTLPVTPSDEVGLFVSGIARVWIENGVWNYSGTTNIGESAGGPAGGLGAATGSWAVIQAQERGGSIEVGIYINGNSPPNGKCAAKFTIGGTFASTTRFGIFAEHGGVWTNPVLRCNCAGCPGENTRDYTLDCDDFDPGITRGSVGTPCKPSGGTCAEAVEQYIVRGVDLANPGTTKSYGSLRWIPGTDQWGSPTDLLLDISAPSLTFNGPHQIGLSKNPTLSAFDCLGVSKATGTIEVTGDPDETDADCKCQTKLLPYDYCIVPIPDIPPILCSTCERCYMLQDMQVEITQGTDPGPGPVPPYRCDFGACSYDVLQHIIGSHRLTGSPLTGGPLPDCFWSNVTNTSVFVPSCPMEAVNVGSPPPFDPCSNRSPYSQFTIKISTAAGAGATPDLQIRASGGSSFVRVNYSAAGLTCNGTTTWNKYRETVRNALLFQTPVTHTDAWPQTITSMEIAAA